jgi:hypothetical protein
MSEVMTGAPARCSSKSGARYSAATAFTACTTSALSHLAAQGGVGRCRHHDGHDAPVVGDQQIPIQRVRKGTLLQARELRGPLGQLLEEVPHDEILAVAQRLARVDQARDLVEVRYAFLELGVEVTELRQEGQIEDLGRMHRDDDHLLAAELPAEGVVHHAGGIVLVKQGLRGGLDLELSELGAESQRHEEQERDGRPGTPRRDAPPARQRVLDPGAKGHVPALARPGLLTHGATSRGFALHPDPVAPSLPPIPLPSPRSAPGRSVGDRNERPPIRGMMAARRSRPYDSDHIRGG